MGSFEYDNISMHWSTNFQNKKINGKMFQKHEQNEENAVLSKLFVSGNHTICSTDSAISRFTFWFLTNCKFTK